MEKTTEKAEVRKEINGMRLFPDLRMSIAKFKNTHREKKHPHDRAQHGHNVCAGSIVLNH